MKFQNSSIHGSKVMLCNKKRDERMDGKTDGTTQKQYAPSPPPPPPPNFLEVGGIIITVLPLFTGSMILLLYLQYTHYL